MVLLGRISVHQPFDHGSHVRAPKSLYICI
jgi:hypothetical protein